MNKPVYITGYGIYSCLGTNVEAVERSLRNGKRGYGFVAERQEIGYQSALAGILPDAPKPHELTQRQWLRHSQSARYAYYAVKELLERTGLTDKQKMRCGLVVSCDTQVQSLSETIDAVHREHTTRYLGMGKVFSDLTCSVSMNLANDFGLHGPSLTVSAACAGGLQAVGIAKMWVENAVCDNVIVVGAQEVNEYSALSFDALGIFSKTDCNPFSKQKDGIIPSGGAAALLLSNENEGKSPAIYGFSANTAKDLICPDVEAEALCMSKAHCYPWQVDVCFAHATGTKAGDESEEEAILNTLGADQTVQVMKALTGHEMSMSGVSTVVYAMIQRDGKFLARTMFEEPDTTYLHFTKELEYTAFKTMQINAFGIGGNNTSILIS